MVDYNFFEGYSIKKVRTSSGHRYVNMLFFMALALLLAYIGFNHYRVLEQRSEIMALDRNIATLKNEDDIARIYNKERLLEELITVVESMEEAGGSISTIGQINEEMLIAIADALPSDVNLSHLEINDYGVEVRGTGMSKAAIAAFERNLRKASIVDDLFITRINRHSDEDYTFDISMSIGGDVHED